MGHIQVVCVLFVPDMTPPRFLTLILDNGSFFVPTLDIDLAWQYVSRYSPLVGF